METAVDYVDATWVLYTGFFYQSYIVHGLVAIIELAQIPSVSKLE